MVVVEVGDLIFWNSAIKSAFTSGSFKSAASLAVVAGVVQGSVLLDTGGVPVGTWVVLVGTGTLPVEEPGVLRGVVRGL